MRKHRNITGEWFGLFFVLEPNSGCWLWRRYLDNKGYGRINVGGKAKYAHRVSWELYRSKIPFGVHVLHKCDVPACVNPEHLFLGTAAHNAHDKTLKGRAAKKLTAETVRAIRSDPRNDRQVACAYGVSFSLISQVRLRQVWKHVL